MQGESIIHGLLVRLQRNLYYEHPAVTARTDEEIAAFRKEKQVRVMCS
jgi:hypothetical protein